MRNAVRAASLSVLLVAVLSAATTTETALHFALSKSSPEAGTTVEAPSSIQLWFTQEPQDGTTSIRLVEAEEAGVHVTEAAQDPDDPTSFSVQLHGSLPAGSYTVSWRGMGPLGRGQEEVSGHLRDVVCGPTCGRGMGQDGHVIRDSFQFSVAAQ